LERRPFLRRVNSPADRPPDQSQQRARRLPNAIRRRGRRAEVNFDDLGGALVAPVEDDYFLQRDDLRLVEPWRRRELENSGRAE
jgi:hypothetical protein